MRDRVKEIAIIKVFRLSLKRPQMEQDLGPGDGVIKKALQSSKAIREPKLKHGSESEDTFHDMQASGWSS